MDQQTNIKDILLKLGYTHIRENINEYRMRPIYRVSDNDSALCVYKQTGKWVDYVTGQSGYFKDLIKLSNGSVSAAENINFKLAPSLKKFVTSSFDACEVEKNHTYWNNRGISNETLDIFNGGVCLKGKMNGRYVFPIKLKDIIYGFSGRAIEPKIEPKWKHIGNKNKWIYPEINLSNIDKLKEVILVESIGDCLSLYEVGIKNCLVIFGINLSDAILLELLKKDLNKIIIALNNDSINNKLAGNNASEKIYKKIRNHFENIQIKLPTKKDFNEMLIDNPASITLWKD